MRSTSHHRSGQAHGLASGARGCRGDPLPARGRTAGQSTLLPAPALGAETPVRLIKPEIASPDLSAQNFTNVNEKVTSHAPHSQAPVFPELFLSLSSLGVLPAEDQVGATATIPSRPAASSDLGKPCAAVGHSLRGLRGIFNIPLGDRRLGITLAAKKKKKNPKKSNKNKKTKIPGHYFCSMSSRLE